MGVKFTASAWGFAEATLFFIVPDVYTSAVALQDLKKALLACLWATAGAIAGGYLIYVVGEIAPDQAWMIIERVPSISREMMHHVELSLRESGAMALLIGPLKGIPYKTFAVQASTTQVTMPLFLLISIPARLFRFLLVTVFVRLLATRVFYKISIRSKQIILFTAWVLFYLFYFSHMPG